jgi:hypothetical protein
MAFGTTALLGTLGGLGVATNLAKQLGLRPKPPAVSNRAALEDAFAAEAEFGEEVADIAGMLPTVARQREYEAFAQGFGSGGPRGMQRQVAARDASRRADVGSVVPTLEALKLKKEVAPLEVQKKRRAEMGKAAAQLAAQGVNTPEQIIAVLGPLTGGDPVLLSEARVMAGGGRLFQTGTAPGFVEDIGSFIMG